MAKDATSSVGQRGRTSRPEPAGGTSIARRRLAREGSGRVPTRPDPDADRRDRGGGKIAIEPTNAQVQGVLAVGLIERDADSREYRTAGIG